MPFHGGEDRLKGELNVQLVSRYVVAVVFRADVVVVCEDLYCLS